MKVILREEVGSLGNAGDMVTVKDGYARNFLIPRKLAIRADERNVKELEHTRRALLARRTKLEDEAKSMAETIDSVGRVVVTRACGVEGKLFGSVTSKDLVKAFADRGISIERRRIGLQEPLKSLGDFDLTVKLGQGVVASIKVSVEPDDDSAAAIAEHTTQVAAAQEKTEAADSAGSEASEAEGEEPTSDAADDE